MKKRKPLPQVPHGGMSGMMRRRKKEKKHG